MDINMIKSLIVIHGHDGTELGLINVQASDDLEKEYELELKVRLKHVISMKTDNIHESARTQIEFDIVEVKKFKEED